MYFEKKRRNQESNFPAGAEDVLCDVDIMKTGPIQKNRTGYHPIGSTESCLLDSRAKNKNLAQYRDRDQQNDAKAQAQRVKGKKNGHCRGNAQYRQDEGERKGSTSGTARGGAGRIRISHSAGHCLCSLLIRCSDCIKTPSKKSIPKIVKVQKNFTPDSVILHKSGGGKCSIKAAGGKIWERAIGCCP